MPKYAGWTYPILQAICLWFGKLILSYLPLLTGPWKKKEEATGKAIFYAEFDI